MDYSQLVVQLKEQFDNNQPFVVYKKPNQNRIKAWLQQSDQLFETDDFEEEGFVFAPFNIESSAVLFPKSNCTILESNVPDFELEELHVKKSGDFSAAQSYQDLIKKAVNHIEHTELSKVVLSRTIQINYNRPKVLMILFNRLLQHYSNAFNYLWFHPKVGLWLGATPERLLHLKRNALKTVSLAGTLPKDSDAQWSNKEVEEQQVVTDFIVDELKTLSSKVSVEGPITSIAGKLRHLKSEISAQINSDIRLKSIIEKLHPTPAVCGFPKEEAKTFIASNEPYDRRFYTGFLGEINCIEEQSRTQKRRNTEHKVFKSLVRSSSLHVNLRCVELEEDSATIYVGGGIVEASDPKKEWEETIEKSGTILSIL